MSVCHFKTTGAKVQTEEDGRPANIYNLFPTLDSLFEKQSISRLDFHFAKTVARVYKETGTLAEVSLALVSHALALGNICLELPGFSGKTIWRSEDGVDTLVFPPLDEWRAALNASRMVSGTSETPMVLDPDNCLYLSRYFDFQCRLVENIYQRLSEPYLSMDITCLNPVLDKLFPDGAGPVQQQKKIVQHTFASRFNMISGGPGTGKTYVINAIQKAHLAFAKFKNLPAPRIICAAPTGKAASKMDRGRTIHSILKPQQNGTGFYYHRRNRLPMDLLIVDEASMIDVSLLTRLLEAVPDKAGVVISGDIQQLASVQAGSVFSDICHAKIAAPVTHLLTHNFRSRGKTGIENLANAISQNRPDEVEKILTQHKYKDIEFIPVEHGLFSANLLKPHVLNGFEKLMTAPDIAAAFKYMDAFKVLCAHNLGEYGTLSINHVCEKILRSFCNSGIQDRLYKRLVMVNANDYKKGLFNGDTGIETDRQGQAVIAFLSNDGTQKSFRATDLPGSETAFAISVHKSQGSEFDTVFLLLPDRLSPVMTRQLLYTGVTRARKKVLIAGNMDIISAAVNTQVNRSSGIVQALNAKTDGS